MCVEGGEIMSQSLPLLMHLLTSDDPETCMTERTRMSWKRCAWLSVPANVSVKAHNHVAVPTVTLPHFTALFTFSPATLRLI